MISMIRSLFCLLFLWSTLSNSWAGVAFTEVAKSTTADPDAETASIFYEFKNTGNGVIKIKEVEVSCVCLSAELDRLEYAAGEAGKLRLNFKLGMLRGEMVKTATVHFSDGSRQELTGTVIVPELLSYSPKTVKWAVGQEGAKQVIDIQVNGKEDIHITEVKPSSDVFQIQLKTIKSGRQYQLEITPKSTEKVAYDLIHLTTNSSAKRFQQCQLFAVINQAPPSMQPSNRR